ncbi:MAG: gamma-glutamyltransferase [Caldilineaceae bacterium]
MSVTRSQLLINKTEVVAAQGMVTAMHPLAAEAGMTILQQGGNAADAAVASAFAVGVVEPFMSGLGGAAYGVAHDAATGRTLTFDGSVEVPQGARPDMFDLLDPAVKGAGVYGWRGTKDNAAESGYRSAVVPGAVATYARLLAECGTMTLREVLAPAIRLAGEGFPVDWYVFANSAASMARLQAFPHTMATFFHPNGTPYKPALIDDVGKAEWLVQTELARTLTLIADQGPDAFYRGEIARRIADHMGALGGIISAADLARYDVRIREPLWIEYRGNRIAFIAQNSGGTSVAQMLNLLEGFDLAALGHNSAATLHLIAEAQHMAYADRFAHLGDPDFAPIPLAGLESKAYAAARRRQIKPNGPPITEPVGDPWPFQPGGRPNHPLVAGSADAADQHTTHLTVVDRSRNIVSLTASLGQLFGSGIVVPGTGVTLNNGMMWYDPEPGKLNSIGPGKRALHAGTPAIAFDDDGPFLAVGSPGGRKVLTAVQQILHNVIDFGLGMQDAVSAPAASTVKRRRVTWMPACPQQ